jgi:hypothetical protein
VSALPACDPSPALRLYVLCAAWCRVCDGYHQAVAAEFPALRWQWVDIEDAELLIGEAEIENFPTLLLSRDEELLFAGPVAASEAVLRRLLAAAAAGGLRALEPDGEYAALARRLRGAPQPAPA